MTELSLYALLPKMPQSIIFLKTNKEITSVYHFGSRIYKDNINWIQKLFSREGRTVTIYIQKYRAFARLKGVFAKSCVIGKIENPDFVVTAEYLVKSRGCGAEHRKYRYFVKLTKGKPQIIAYRYLGGHNICCAQLLEWSHTPASTYLIGCKKVYVHFNKQNNNLLIMPYSDEDKNIKISNINIECFKNGLRNKDCIVSTKIEGLKLEAKIAEVDSLVIDLSEAI